MLRVKFTDKKGKSWIGVFKNNSIKHSNTIVKAEYIPTKKKKSTRVKKVTSYGSNSLDSQLAKSCRW